MGYQIEYGKDRKPLPQGDHSGIRIFLMSTAFFLAFCLFVNAWWPKGSAFVGNLLFPGGAEPAMAAAEVFVEELRHGTPVSDALENFCRVIINNADYP